MPVPVNITVNMSILTEYQTDMDQILSNFVAYSNPYIIISWKIPEDFGVGYTQEIRSEVLWNGSIPLDYPIEQTANSKPRINAETSFTIKGWIFPAVPDDPFKNIFFIVNLPDSMSIVHYLQLMLHYQAVLKQLVFLLHLNSDMFIFHT